MSRMMFVNLAVADLDKAKAFFAGLGFSFDPAFTDENAASMVVAPDHGYVMLLRRDYFASFARKPVADATAATGVMVALSASSRADADALADKALELGGTPAADPVDYGFMYGRSFYDLDGHHWEVAYMDMAAFPGAPAE